MYGKAPDLESLLDSQRQFFAAGGTRAPAMRLEALARLRQTLEQRKAPLLDALAEDLGKPPVEAFLAEYYFLMQEIRLVERSLRRWLKPRRARSPVWFWPCSNRIRLEPRGCSLVMSPWNYPVQLALAPLIASVAAGNTIVLKPSELAPAAEAFTRDLVADCFVPEHAAVVTGGPDISAQLIAQHFDFVFFTGSTRVGRLVARAAAEHLTPHILELGGKCPCIVHPSADLDITARRILTAKLFNAGQTCFSPDHVLVHEDIRQDLTSALVDALERYPWERELARIVNRSHYDRLQALIEEPAHAKGEDDPERLHIAPRILPAATRESPIMQEEIFGPLLPVLGYQDEATLFDSLKRQPAPLALYCFARDRGFTEALIGAVPSGGVGINDCGKQAANLDLPFGGVGASGHGRYRGRHGIEAFSYQRAVTRRWFTPDPFEVNPPRQKSGRFLQRWLG
jgi:aldehyde dehydrogenase (NAD+)